MSAYADDEAVPQFARVRVPEHVGCVVVAVRAERLADGGRVRGVDGSAAEGAPVFAGGAVAAGTASVVSGAVDRAEGGGGQGDEEPGAVADVGGDVLAAG